MRGAGANEGARSRPRRPHIAFRYKRKGLVGFRKSRPSSSCPRLAGPGGRTPGAAGGAGECLFDGAEGDEFAGGGWRRPAAPRPSPRVRAGAARSQACMRLACCGVSAISGRPAKAAVAGSDRPSSARCHPPLRHPPLQADRVGFPGTRADGDAAQLRDVAEAAKLAAEFARQRTHHRFPSSIRCRLQFLRAIADDVEAGDFHTSRCQFDGFALSRQIVGTFASNLDRRKRPRRLLDFTAESFQRAVNFGNGRPHRRGADNGAFEIVGGSLRNPSRS